MCSPLVLGLTTELYYGLDRLLFAILQTSKVNQLGRSLQ